MASAGTRQAVPVWGLNSRKEVSVAECVIIFGQDADMHVSAVASKLRNSGVEVLVFDQYRDTGALVLGVDQQGGRWPFSEIVAGHARTTIWNRVKPISFSPCHPHLCLVSADDEDAFANYQTYLFWQREWRIFFNAVTHFYRDDPSVRIVNSGELFGPAMSKPLQLLVASRIGLTVPPTVFGNDARAIDATLGDSVLFKSSSDLPISGKGLLPPAVLPKSAVTGNPSVSIGPLIFQDRIEKRYELRVTVSGEKAVFVRINSQSVEYGKIDWRVASARPDIFERTGDEFGLLPKLLTYMEQMSLDVGTFDFAVDLSGQPVFFECNPAGQWLFVGDEIGQDISHQVAECLTAVR